MRHEEHERHQRHDGHERHERHKRYERHDGHERNEGHDTCPNKADGASKQHNLGLSNFFHYE